MTRTTIAVVFAAAMVLVVPAAHATFPMCSYSPLSGGSVDVFMHDDEFVRVFVDEGGEIKAKFDPEEVDCGDATTENTIHVSIDGSKGEDLIVISQNGEGGRFPRSIGFTVDGQDGPNEIRLIGTPRADSFRFGVDPADLGARPAADLYGTGPARIAIFEVEAASARMLAGNDEATGKPGEGFDGALTIPLTLDGGRGADTLIGSPTVNLLSGGPGDDVLRGLAEADQLFGGDGDDALNGGPGADSCRGGRGTDVLRACEA